MVKEVYSTYELAKLCHVHQTTIIKWIKEGRLSAYETLGGHRRVKKENFLRFLEDNKLPVPDCFNTSSVKTILIVDDEVASLYELNNALDGYGFNIKLASSGFEAGASVQKYKPDLILLDFMMPDMDGFAVCKFLQKDSETSKVPIFAITGLTSDEDVAKIRQHGVKEYIQKPIDILYLLGLINKYLKLDLKIA